MPPPVPEKIKCASEQLLKEELVACEEVLVLPETEDSWEKLSRAIQRMSALIKGGAYKFPQSLVPGVKSLSRPLLSAMNSERTRLSATVLELLTNLIARLDRHFEPLMPIFIPSVLKLCTRTNKLYIARARALLDTVTTHSALTSVVPYFQCCWDDKSTTLRLAAADSMVAALKKFNPPDLSRYIAQVESAIKSTSVDKDPAVRTTGRKMFECYKDLWPDRVDSFITPLSAVTRKYLEITSRTRTISVLSDARDPLSVSVPSSQGTARPGLRRSLSLDALYEVKAPKVDRRLQVHQTEVTKVVPVRRAAKPISKEGPPRAVLPPKALEEPVLTVTSTWPSLARAKSVANLRSLAESSETTSAQNTNQTEAKGARRVVQPTQPVVQPPPRTGPTRPISVAAVAIPVPQEAATGIAPVAQPASEAPVTSTDLPTKGGGERRGHGAQRVAIPPPPPPKPQSSVGKTEGKDGTAGPARAAQPVVKANSFKPQARTGRIEMKPSTVATGSGTRERSVARSDQTAKDSRPTSRAESSRPNSRLQSRKLPLPAKTVAKKPIATQPLAKGSKGATESQPAAVRRGLSAPTRAQLERAKALEDERGKAKSTSTRSAIPSKRGFVPVRGRGVVRGVATRTVSKAPSKERIPEADVPLPSSPKAGPIDQEKNIDNIQELNLLSPEEPKLTNVQTEQNQVTVNSESSKAVHSQISEELVSVPEDALLVIMESPDVIAPIDAEPPESESTIQAQAGAGAVAGLSAPSELDRLLFASPMKTIVFDPPHASSPFVQDTVYRHELPDKVSAEPNQTNPTQPISIPQAPHDPYASLPFFLREALAAPIPPTPDVRPSAFIRFENDDTTIAYSSNRVEEDIDDDSTMEKLEFNVNGVDPFGRTIHSPCKRPAPARDALVDLSVNQ